MSDLAFVFFMAICFLLALAWDDDGGGGKRQTAGAPC